MACLLCNAGIKTKVVRYIKLNGTNKTLVLNENTFQKLMMLKGMKKRKQEK